MFDQLSRKLSIKRFVRTIISVLALTSSAIAGAGGGRIEGSVVDPTSAKVAGARVVLRDAAGLVAYETRTDKEGHFSIAEVANGRYQVTVEAPGFSQRRQATVELRKDASETVNIQLEIAAISDHLIVTATRTATSTNELGGSISVVTDEDLTLKNYSLVSEPLRQIPGLAVVQTGGRGGLTSIFTRGGESDYNKVLIDGVPVNRAGGAFDFAFLTPENVERIEVVRGPQSAIFGSDAMTSAIQIFTRRGVTPVPEFELQAEGGSFDFHREAARLSGVAHWFDYSGAVGYQTTGGRFRNSDYINRSASANLGFRLSPRGDLRITSRWNDGTLGVPGPTSILFADPDARQKHRDLALAATFSLRTATRFHQTARFVYSEFDTNNFDPNAQDLTKAGTPLAGPNDFGGDFRSAFKDHQKRSGVHYQGIAAVTSSNVVTAGVDFEHESAVLTSSNDFSRSRVSPDRNNLGFYVQDQAAWRARLFVTGGVRFERNTGTVPDDLRRVLESLGSVVPSGDIGFGWAANPRISVSALAREHQDSALLGATRLKGSFGTGIKEPTLDEAFSPSSDALGNPGLEPERATSFEIGAVQELFGRRASVELTYYDNRFRNLVIFESTTAFGPIRLPSGVLTNFVNADRASGRGLELIASARPGGSLRRLRLLGTYTFLRSRLDRAADVLAFPPPTFEAVLVPNPELGLPLLRRPRNSGSFEISWINQRFDVTLDGSIVGRRRDFIPFPFAKFDRTGHPVFNDGYERLSVAGSYRVNRFLSAFARVDNLLNQNYQEVLGFPAYRLNFSGGLRVKVGSGK